METLVWLENKTTHDVQIYKERDKVVQSIHDALWLRDTKGSLVWRDIFVLTPTGRVNYRLNGKDITL